LTPPSQGRKAQPSDIVNGDYFSEEGIKSRDKRKKKLGFEFLVAVYRREGIANDIKIITPEKPIVNFELL
jgi:hypothetical protein